MCPEGDYAYDSLAWNEEYCAPEVGTIGKCDHWKYYDEQEKECKGCYGACKTCTGPNENDCLSCYSFESYLKDDGTCGCNDGYFMRIDPDPE